MENTKLNMMESIGVPNNEKIWQYIVDADAKVLDAFNSGKSSAVTIVFNDCTVITSAFVFNGDKYNVGSRGPQTIIIKGDITRIHESMLN